MTIQRFLQLGLCLILLLPAPIVYSKQWALVVGVNKYPGLSADKQLQGAINDANLLTTRLRAKGVDLPDKRVLLNEKATVANFKAAFKDLLSSAQAGDELIITFSGHGGQEVEFAEPKDEQDNKDETLMFYDFAGGTSTQGRMSDDELYSLFATARQFSVLFVADTCHSGGISRSVSMQAELPSRGILDTYTPQASSSFQSPESDDRIPLAHVSYLAATENEILTVPEINIPADNKVHGALSFSFAKALTGKADSDNDHIITRAELKQYVTDQVGLLTDHHQQPGLLPRGDSNQAFALTASEPEKPVIPTQTLAIKVEGGRVPSGVLAIHEHNSQYRLRFLISDNKVTAYNPLGDRLTQFDAADVAAWNKLIAKYRLLTAIDNIDQSAAEAVNIKLVQGDGLHTIGEHLNFEFNLAGTQRYFFLVDLAGSGEWQWLYPKLGKDETKLSSLPYPLKLKVEPPTGEDDMLAIFCADENPALKQLIKAQDGKTAATPEIFLSALGSNCRIGRYAFFTGEH